ncbi:hypothetical protein D8674_025859 [Pyrus ussuriensis x Pyrus communis]|uniref:Uncharacterized protein n=1 Tax=Pyrus ussuriensis x Pyrus communis TaxID=2448454 RepID=A0A5N5I557_9ROSA|nr:hypothetical protein D8674_025859 [Pyrus ussuriensis x Pyrus communis]
MTTFSSQLAEASLAKRGADPQGMEMTQSSQKKAKSHGNKEERKEKTTEKLRGMSINERCLMVEKALYAEEEL